MNAPRKQSATETPQTPHAMLRPDHGTTPIKRRTERRTQTGVLFCEVEFELESPCRTFLVTVRARGNHRDNIGAIGLDKREERIEPIAVRSVRSRVAQAGWKRAPLRTF